MPATPDESPYTRDCPTCQMSVIMAETLLGKAVPVNSVPVRSAPEGWRLTARIDRPPLATRPDATRAFGALLYVLHQPTCTRRGRS